MIGGIFQGAGSFEVAARQHLINEVKKTVQGRAQLGVEAFADALLVVPKTLAENSGLDTQDVLIALKGAHDRGNIVGLNQHSGEPIDPQMEGIFDNYSVKRQIINSGPVIASQLLLVDEIGRILNEWARCLLPLVRDKKTISYMAERDVGSGSFGIVFQAKCLETGETFAIKKVLQDRRYKNRELQLTRLMDHPNVVSLKHCFFSTTSKDELFLNLVMEYVPETMYRVLKHYSSMNQRMPLIYVKLYTYQIYCSWGLSTRCKAS